MKLTWLGHSCFRLERDGFVAVVDPGVVAPADALDDADAVLITHQHADHFLPSLIAGRLRTRPGLPVWTNRDVAALLAGSGASVRVIGPGDAFDAGGIEVHAHTDPHAPVNLLFVPEFGLYTRFGYAIDFIRLPEGTPIEV